MLKLWIHNVNQLVSKIGEIQRSIGLISIDFGDQSG